EAFGVLLDHRDFPTAWRRDPFGRTGAIDGVLGQLAGLGALAAQASRPDHHLARNLLEVAHFVSENVLREAVRGRDYDGLEADLRELARLRSWGWKGWPGVRFGPLSRDEVLGLRDAAKAELDAMLAACDADLAPLLQEALRPAVAIYEELKARAGRLDFLDL